MPVISFANPPGIPTPKATYSLTAEVAGARRWLVVSGQVPATADGSVPQDAAGQARLVAANLRAALAHHGMGPANIVKFTSFMLNAEARAAWAVERDAMLAGGPAPASTLIYVSGLADPRWLMEVEILAAD